jgi:hypothetical protein
MGKLGGRWNGSVESAWLLSSPSMHFDCDVEMVIDNSREFPKSIEMPLHAKSIEVPLILE